METFEGVTVYFSRPGRENTEETLRIAQKRAQELGIKTIVVATTRGDTGARAVEVFEGFRVVAVSHSTGLKEPDAQELTPENRARIEERGGVVLTTTHALGGVGRAVRRRLNTYQVDEIIAYTLRLLGEGMKVVTEIAVMAADAGLIRTDEEVICIAGTDRGSDTAVVLKPAHAQDFFHVRIKEILCKPRL